METELLNITETKTGKILQPFGLNWEVEKRPLYYSDKFGNDIKSWNFAMVRSDNDEQLGTSKSEYTVVQNHEIYEIMVDICKTDNLEIANAGTFNGGRKVFFFLKRPENITIGDDTVEKYIFALSSHDGSKSLALGIANKVISCQNQFNRFYKSADAKITHSGNAEIKIANLTQILQIHHKEEEKMYENFHRWQGNSVTKALVDQFTNRLFDVDLSAKQAMKISTRKENIMQKVTEAISHEIEDKGANMFALFNGVTYYNNNLKMVTEKSDRENASLEDIFTGTGHNLNNKAYELLLEIEGTKVKRGRN